MCGPAALSATEDSVQLICMFFVVVCRNMYLDKNRTNPIEFQIFKTDKGQGHFFVSGPKFTKLFSSNVEKIVVANAIFHLSIA